MAKLEILGFIPHMLSVSQYNMRMIEGKAQEVKSILSKFTHPVSVESLGSMDTSQ